MYLTRIRMNIHLTSNNIYIMVFTHSFELYQANFIYVLTKQISQLPTEEWAQVTRPLAKHLQVYSQTNHHLSL